MRTTEQTSIRSSIAERAGLFRLASLALAVSVASCGGGGGSATTAITPTPQNTGPFSMISGGLACGTGALGCAADSSTGGGVGSGSGSGGDGGDGAGGGLGQMRNVRVLARSPDGTTLGLAAMQDNLVSIYPHSYTGPFILEFRTDGSGTGAYYDEALQAWTLLGPTQALHVLVPSLTHHLSVNALSEAAYQWALAKYGSEANFTAEHMAAANTAVATAVNAVLPSGYTIADITEYAAAVSDTTAPNSLPNTHAGRFATVLAAQALAAQAYNNSQPNPIVGFKPALAFALELGPDLIANNAITGSVAGASAYGTSFTAAMAQAAATAWGLYATPAQPSVQAPTQCFNPALFTTAGTMESLSYDDGSSISLAVSNVAFQGVSNAVQVAITSSSSTSGSTGTVDEYYSPNASSGLLAYGSMITSVIGSSTYVDTVVYSPPSLNTQFLLEPGASSSYTINSTSTSTVNGVSQGSPTTLSLQNTTTFNGYYAVTVPAGTFNNTCQYTTITTTPAVTTGGSPSTSTTVTWITASGFGVPVKTSTTVNGTTTTKQLTSGTVNGVPVK